jgi:hypothetical protein
MKTPLFFLAALAAFFLLPLDFTATVSVLFGAGLAAILVSDYKRTLPTLRVPAVAASAPRSKQTLRLAA